ncbi:MAG: hypothetical protein IJP92_15655 [Lachnospiraceae bacterium]|nr:hypothetical protein [Lachnospiraceae bacterium]
MYECTACAAPLRFDIDTQMLKCDNCGNTYDPDAYQAEGRDVETREDFDVRVYTCPQCAGEIMATNTTATTFCAYCGANVMLRERMEAQQKPEIIIPFRKNKNDCMQAYSTLLRRMIYAPKELRSTEHLSRAVGIYMPYWVFGARVDGEVTLPGKTTVRDGDYKQITTYDLTSQVQASYTGLSHDASKGFADDFSAAIAPYQMSGARPFNPALLSGFFADIADTNPMSYAGDATKIIAKNIYERVADVQKFKRFGVETELSDEKKAEKLKLQNAEVKRAFFPVWFLTFRQTVSGGEDRVAYAVMNGQTGRIAADIPVSEKKYLIASLLLTVPIFLLLNLAFTIPARAALVVSMVLAALVFLIFIAELVAIRARDMKFLSEVSGTGGAPPEKMKKSLKPGSAGASAYGWSVTSFAGIAAAVAVLLWNPVADFWYYGGATLVYLCICVTLVGLIRKYNVLATRPLPSFHEREGGRDHA